MKTVTANRYNFLFHLFREAEQKFLTVGSIFSKEFFLPVIENHFFAMWEPFSFNFYYTITAAAATTVATTTAATTTTPAMSVKRELKCGA